MLPPLAGGHWAGPPPAPVVNGDSQGMSNSPLQLEVAISVDTGNASSFGKKTGK